MRRVSWPPPASTKPQEILIEVSSLCLHRRQYFWKTGVKVFIAQVQNTWKTGIQIEILAFFSPSTCPFHHCVSKLALLKFSSRVPRRDGEAHRSANYWKCLGVLYLNLQRVKLLWQRNIIAHEISQLRVQGCGSGRLSALTRLRDEREG